MVRNRPIKKNIRNFNRHDPQKLRRTTTSPRPPPPTVCSCCSSRTCVPVASMHAWPTIPSPSGCSPRPRIGILLQSKGDPGSRAASPAGCFFPVVKRCPDDQRANRVGRPSRTEALNSVYLPRVLRPTSHGDASQPIQIDDRGPRCTPHRCVSISRCPGCYGYIVSQYLFLSSLLQLLGAVPPILPSTPPLRVCTWADIRNHTC